MQNERNDRKVLKGVVTSDKMQKTITVAVESRKKDPMYGKTVTSTKKYKAHDENEEAHVGDRVKIMETRPLRATTRWRLVKIVEKAK